MQKIHDLIGSAIRATDGALGSVKTFFFDDEQWVIRYMVVDTGTWLTGRQVLISPHSVRDTNWQHRTVDVSLTREQVKGSPDVDLHRPVSRQHELQHAVYYGYPYYWGQPILWGAAGYPGALEAPRSRSEIEEAERQLGARAGDSHLRDASKVKGYRIQASDGEIGHVDDFMIDEASWAIRYMVVDTSKWWSGRRVLIAPTWIREVSWEESAVFISVTRDQVKRSPEYDPAGDVARGYEEDLYSHYGQSGYWIGDRAGAEANQKERFARLDDVRDLEVSDDDPDVRHWNVVASDGKRIGKVEHLIVDRPAMKVRYLEVGIEGDTERTPGRDVLIPLSDVSLDRGGETVRVSSLSSSAVLQLPAFTGLPVADEYDEAFRRRADAGGGPARAGEVRLRCRSVRRTDSIDSP